VQYVSVQLQSDLASVCNPRPYSVLVGTVRCEALEWELRERREQEEEKRQEAEELGAGGEEQPLFLHTLLHGLCGRGVGRGGSFSLLFPLSFLGDFLGAPYMSLGRPGKRTKGSSQ